MSQPRRNSSMTDASSTNMLPPSRSPGMGHPVSPQSLGNTISARDTYSSTTPGLLRYSHNTSPRSSEAPRYSSVPDRSLLQTSMSMGTSNVYGSVPALSYSMPTDRAACESPPFHPQVDEFDITCEGSKILPTIEAKIDKGFFWSNDRVWTCYRRNYFAVTVSYGFNPWPNPQGRLYITRNGKSEQIQSFAVYLAAAVDGANGKAIELIQHTPKRDKGPQLAMKKELLTPSPPGKSHDHNGYGMGNFHAQGNTVGPSLPLQDQTDPSQSQPYTNAGHHASSSYQHAFERIQFKYATANNGKRRAQQQYYHLIVELYANIQNPRDAEPNWVKISSRLSEQVVVRGRSPSHYSNEGPHNGNAGRGGAGSGVGGPGFPGLGSNGSGYNTHYRNGLSGNNNSNTGGAMYRGTNYSLDPSPVASHVGSHSVSSASSLSGGPVEGLVPEQHMMEADDGKLVEGQHEYQYYPATIYENMPPKLDGPCLPIPERRIKEEFPPPSSMSSGWSGGGCGRYQGLESSRGYYPDVPAHVGY